MVREKDVSFDTKLNLMQNMFFLISRGSRLVKVIDSHLLDPRVARGETLAGPTHTKFFMNLCTIVKISLFW